MPQCGCGTDAWKITQTDVNVMSATENVYGDLEALNEVDVSDIQSALIRMDMWVSWNTHQYSYLT